MAEEFERVPPPPLIVEYCPVTGLPPEYNDCLPKDSDEYKKWTASQEGTEGLEKLTLTDKDGKEVEVEKKLPGGKVKKKAKLQVRGMHANQDRWHLSRCVRVCMAARPCCGAELRIRHSGDHAACMATFGAF